MKTLIEIHVLQNFAPSNLNRDDTGAPKDAFFGGTRRGRVSSQCNKRALREYFKAENEEYFASRTKRVLDSLITRIDPKVNGSKMYSAENLEKAVTAAIGCIGAGDKKVKIEKDKKNGQLKTDVLLFLSNSEIDALAVAIEGNFDELLKAKVGGEVAKRITDSIDGKENKSRLSLDIALFGRMLAVMPEKNQYAACQVAHAISTHTIEREFDFYTAVDDLKPEDTAGADMMGTVEFNSACYYRYAVVDWEKLLTNLQGDVDLATKGLRVFLQGFVHAEPTGKQNSFAAHNPPEFVTVTLGRDAAPRNLANAFETAIRAKPGESLTCKSAEALAAKAITLEKAYPRKGKTHVLNVLQAGVGGLGAEHDSLEALLAAVLADLQE
ncbi:type I-E CRISPR-associated protein Cas7/Cse4/CasC [Stutzerimonas stutzeri]|uniref:type I-E CRISPR-associated protein Cas7/Cse4/CasC n=1 Tax=Stutzerimonas stutzeri TaxID=316 RepID=UPI00210C516B|nr:type I-E CRISPR-associated protein Cas7/Cse4/CasC [Stutzerimonas stutzeri]MCQ4321968.1 type I-E CRISPR-associated protein Cas7/Cse4/CasC [Stutzerimonas stutzeri]